MAGPAVPWRWLEHVGNGVSQIDGCLRQNPAYRQAHKNMAPFRQFRKGAFFSFSYQSSLSFSQLCQTFWTSSLSSNISSIRSMFFMSPSLSSLT